MSCVSEAIVFVDVDIVALTWVVLFFVLFGGMSRTVEVNVVVLIRFGHIAVEEMIRKGFDRCLRMKVDLLILLFRLDAEVLFPNL